MSLWSELGELEAALRVLVGKLGNEDSSLVALDAAWEGCARHEGLIVRIAEQELAGLEGHDENKWRTRLGGVATLNAMAASSCVRSNAAVVRNLDRLRRARFHLEELRSPRPPGDSCDIAG